MKEQRKWKLSDLRTGLKNAFGAIIRGNLLLRLNVGRYFLHIAYTFLLLWIIIFQSLVTENALDKVEKNKLTLRDMQIVLSDKTFEEAMSSRREAVQAKLREMGSPLQEPSNPAIILKNGR